MRNRKRRNTTVSRVIIITLLALSAPVLLSLARSNIGFIGGIGERAAIAAAALNMPEGGLTLLRDRFQSELYDEGDHNPETIENPEPAPVENHNPIPPEPEESAEDEPQQDRRNPVKPPKIPEKYAAPLVSESFAGRDGGTSLRYGDGFIKNETKYADEEITEILEQGFDLDLADTGEPQVLIVHTHATESFERYDNDVYDTRNTWRSTDNNNNMVAVGSAMQQILEENGISVLHDTTQHDYPSYNGSYERSAKTINKYLEEYPSIKIVLDLHRDAMQREDQSIVKPVAMVDGKKAAQIMIISGCDDETMDMPNWRENLRFAAAYTDLMSRAYPGLTRPVYLCYRKYNMDLSNGSLLLEFGSNANTLEEAVYSAQLAGQALADLIWESES